MKPSLPKFLIPGLLGLTILAALLWFYSNEKAAEMAGGFPPHEPSGPTTDGETRVGLAAEAKADAPPITAPERQAALGTNQVPEPGPTFRLEVLDLDGRALGKEEFLVHLSSDPEVIAQMRRHDASQDMDEIRALRNALGRHPACRSSWTPGPFPRPGERAGLLVTKATSGASAWLDLEPPIPDVVTVRLQAEHLLLVDVRDVLGAPVPKFSVQMALQDAEGEDDYSFYGLGSSETDGMGRATIGHRLSVAGLRALAPKTLGLASYFPPNDHAWKPIPIEALELKAPVEWVLPEFGSVELAVDWPEAADDKWLYFAIYDATGQEIDSTREPEQNDLRSSSVLMVPPGRPYTFEFVPVGRRLAATVVRRHGAATTTRYAYFDGPAFQGQFVRITPR